MPPDAVVSGGIFLYQPLSVSSGTSPPITRAACGEILTVQPDVAQNHAAPLDFHPLNMHIVVVCIRIPHVFLRVLALACGKNV